jgi:hypothetical protein
MEPAARPPRHADWKHRLDAYLARHARTPFAWSEHNCATFCAGWVFEATGLAIELPVVDDEGAAHGELAAAGGIEAAVTARLGEPVLGAFARQGDIVLVRLPVLGGMPRRALSVCVGAAAAGPGPSGLMRMPISQAEAAWRV